MKEIREQDIERRYISGNMRAVGIGTSSLRFVGYAAKYNDLSDVLGNFREKIAPGFFDNVGAHDVRALFNHDTNFVLGRTTAGTLKLYPDSIGLRVDITPPNTTWANDLTISMQRGDISQMSFAFTMPGGKAGERWEKDANDNWIRTLLKPDRILDVSIVTFPAYPTTSAAVNSYMEKIKARHAARKRLIDLLGSFYIHEKK